MPVDLIPQYPHIHRLLDLLQLRQRVGQAGVPLQDPPQPPDRSAFTGVLHGSGDHPASHGRGPLGEEVQVELDLSGTLRH